MALKLYSKVELILCKKVSYLQIANKLKAIISSMQSCSVYGQHGDHRILFNIQLIIYE